MKQFIKEFKAFALRGNMMDMAVGMIIGGAFSGIVTALIDNFINPILDFIIAGKTYTMNDVATFASAFISAILNFLIMALVLFFLLKGINKLMTINKKDEPAAPKTKTCPYCKSSIAIDATRCPNCTSVLDQK